MQKKIFLIVALLLNASSIKAQTTEGTEFWVTFGQVGLATMTPQTIDDFDFRIRIVGGDTRTFGTIYFTSLGTSIDCDIEPYEIYEYSLEDPAEKYAVYTTVAIGETETKTNYSIRITASNPVSVYASKRYLNRFDVTDILPITALGTKYYVISWTTSPSPIDAYTVIATQNGTQVFHDGNPIEEILNAGEVYYRASSVDMTGACITATANKPVAFFAQPRGAIVPLGGGGTNTLFQQLTPVNTWGKTFFVPVTEVGIDYVRIVVSQNGTNITQTGGTIRTQGGGQDNLSDLQAGQFVELEISLSNNGCFIEADQPVGVCSFMRSSHQTFNLTGACSQVWIPPIEQSISKVLTAPFIYPNMPSHYVLIITPTAAKNDTRVSIGGASPIPLSGGDWYDNAAEGADMSFYNYPFPDFSASYVFSNPAKMIVLGYGLGNIGFYRSYYYLAGFAMRDLDAAFYANDIHFQELQDTIFCNNAVAFRAAIEGELHPEPGRLKWFINGESEEDEYVPARDQLEWNHTFANGVYEITMWARLETGETTSKTGTLKISPLFCCGAGTPENPYLICTAAQLDSVRHFLNKHFKLAKDIPLSAYLAPGGEGYNKWGALGWEPIGNAEDPFTGSLNGDGHKITGLWINRSGDYIGLFGYIDGAVIKNVGVILKKE